MIWLQATALGVAAMVWQSPDSIRATAESAVSALRPGAGVTATISNRLRMPACDKALAATARFSGASTATVTVRCPGESAWQLYVPVRLAEEVKVMVMARPMARGTPISPDDLRAETRPGAALAYGYYTKASSLKGQRLRRALSEGAVLSPNDIEDRNKLRPGAPVTLLSRASGIEVRMNGQVLTTRGHGVVSVKNLSSGLKVTGHLIGPGLVEVMP